MADDINLDQGCGDKIQLTFKNSLTGVAIDLTGAAISFVVVNPDVSPPAPILIQKHDTNAGGGDDQIEVTDATNGLALLKILANDTGGIKPGVYDYYIFRTPSGEQRRREKKNRFTINWSPTY